MEICRNEGRKQEREKKKRSSQRRSRVPPPAAYPHAADGLLAFGAMAVCCFGMGPGPRVPAPTPGGGPYSRPAPSGTANLGSVYSVFVFVLTAPTDVEGLGLRLLLA